MANRKSNSRKLTLRQDMHFIPAGRGLGGVITLQAGAKVDVVWSPSLGFADAYTQRWDGSMWLSTIRAAEGSEAFRNWPKGWL